MNRRPRATLSAAGVVLLSVSVASASVPGFELLPDTPATAAPVAAPVIEDTSGASDEDTLSYSNEELTPKYVGMFREYFTRWPDGIIPWVYDPAGAPKNFPEELAIDLVKRAAAQWQAVSGLRFEFRGVERGAGKNAHPEGLAVIRWRNLGSGSTTARAGPWTYQSGENLLELGYRPVRGGTVDLNPNSLLAGKFDGEIDALVLQYTATIAHELGHLIGLGHSDDPKSLMSAKPYNDRVSLAKDDVRAARDLYGPPDESRKHRSSRGLWLNKPSNELAFDLVDGNKNPIADIRDSTRGTVSVKVVLPGSTVKNSQIIVLDSNSEPILASFESFTAEDRDCESCTWYLPVNEADVLKSLPGAKRVLLALNDRVVASRNLEILTEPRINHMPSLELNADPQRPDVGERVRLRLRYGRDPEGDRLFATWHIPGNGETTVELDPDGGTIERTVRFESGGRYAVYLSLNDDSDRYGGKVGPGFRKVERLLLKVY